MAEERGEGIAPESMMGMLDCEPGRIVAVWGAGKLREFITLIRRRGIYRVEEVRVVAVKLIRADADDWACKSCQADIQGKQQTKETNRILHASFVFPT